MYPAFGNLTWVTPYGAMLAAALGFSWWYARRRAAERKIDVSQIDLAIPLVFVAAIVGARLFTLLSPNDSAVAGDLMQAHGRLRLFGLLIFAPPALLAYCAAAKLPFREMSDLLALPAVLWLAIVRLGCFMAGCCWGDLAVHHPELIANLEPGLASQLVTVPWLTGDWLGLRFPIESFAFEQQSAVGLIGPAATGSLPVHPTQLYEAFGLLIFLYCLRRGETGRWTTGTLALFTFGGYAVLRFLIEFLRADSALLLGNLTFTQILCIALLALCLGACTAMRLAATKRIFRKTATTDRALSSSNL